VIVAADMEPRSVPDLYADRPLVLFGKYQGAGNGSVTVGGRGGDGAFVKTLRAADSAPDRSLAALPQLWARHRIAGLRDVEVFGGPSQRESILGLGLRYHLMTEYTSFVAVDQVHQPMTGQTVTVRQPLPLPRGVSRHALGESAEGETIILEGRAPAGRETTAARPEGRRPARDPAGRGGCGARGLGGHRVDQRSDRGTRGRRALRGALGAHPSGEVSWRWGIGWR
jgi:Ca-activated chloride channel homolog